MIHQDLGVKPQQQAKRSPASTRQLTSQAIFRRGNFLSQTTTGAKHRADRRPVTPLTTLNEYVTGPIGRRTAAAAASTGIIITMTAGGSLASPVADTPTKLPTIRTVDSGDSIEGGDSVSVEKEAKWSFTAATSGTSATPPPPPPPTVEPAETRQAQASRAGTRSAPAQQPAAEAEKPKQEEVSSAPASGTGAAIVAEARKHVGTPYVHGGTSPGAFDCSGFTSYVFSKFGVNLPPSSGAQRNVGRQVSASEARPGDLVWWPGHVGIYTGNGNHIAARNPSTPLYESQLFRGGATYIRVID